MLKTALGRSAPSIQGVGASWPQTPIPPQLPRQVDSGCVADDAAAREACRQLQRLIAGGGDDDGGSVASASTAATSASGRSGFRALEGGPVLLDEMNRVSLHPSEIKKLGKNLIQGLYSGEGGEEDFSLMTGVPCSQAGLFACSGLSECAARRHAPAAGALPPAAAHGVAHPAALPAMRRSGSFSAGQCMLCARAGPPRRQCQSLFCWTFVPVFATIQRTHSSSVWGAAEKDAIKIKKLKEKQEKQQMAAFRCGLGSARCAMHGRPPPALRAAWALEPSPHGRCCGAKPGTGSPGG